MTVAQGESGKDRGQKSHYEMVPNPLKALQLYSVPVNIPRCDGVKQRPPQRRVRNILAVTRKKSLKNILI